MTTQAEISIALRAHSTLPFNERMLYSALLQQTAVPFEVLVLADPALETAEWQRAGARVIPLEAGEASLSGHLLRSMQEMNGKFLLWLDEGEYLFPDAVALASYALQQSRAEILVGSGVTCDESLAPSGNTLIRAEIARHDQLFAALHKAAFSFSGTLISHNVLSNILNSETVSAEEHSLWARIVSTKPSIAWVQSAFLYIKQEGLPARSDAPDSASAVEELLQRNLLEEIFPMFPWEAEPLSSYGTALTYLAMLMIQYGAPASASELLAQTAAERNADSLRPLRALCAANLGRFEEAATLLGGKTKAEGYDRRIG